MLYSNYQEYRKEQDVEKRKIRKVRKIARYHAVTEAVGESLQVAFQFDFIQ